MNKEEALNKIKELQQFVEELDKVKVRDIIKFKDTDAKGCIVEVVSLKDGNHTFKILELGNMSWHGKREWQVGNIVDRKTDWFSKYNNFKILKNYKQQEVDFSKFVGRMGANIAIKGNKYLKSYNGEGIAYDNHYKTIYNEKLLYEEIDHTELEYGDVYYAGSLERAKEGMSLSDFRIHIYFDSDNISVGQVLLDYLGNEEINIIFYGERVVRFLRK